MPLGNQTSQFFANVYLDALDQLIVRRLRPGAYARYLDDLGQNVGRIDEEIIELLPELSSK